jgi:tetratricopeptide (TPR) repeat protein
VDGQGGRPGGPGALPATHPGAREGPREYDPAVLRLVGFFILVLILLQVLSHVPIVGAIFRIPFLGFWITAILLSAWLSRFAAQSLDRRKQKALMRQLGAVETPHNLGKLGSLLEQQGRHKQAIGYLERAAEGEPESAEWHYRLGCARLGAGDAPGALEALGRAVAINEEHAYGEVLLRSAEAATRNGAPEQAFELLARFERNHGPNPESAYRRGLALRAHGAKDQAALAFAEVSTLAGEMAEYHRKGSTRWVLRAFLARLG